MDRMKKLGHVSGETVLPFTPLAGPLGFTPLPAAFFIFLVPATVTYLFAVEVAKRRLMRDFAAEPVTAPAHGERYIGTKRERAGA